MTEANTKQRLIGSKDLFYRFNCIIHWCRVAGAIADKITVGHKLFQFFKTGFGIMHFYINAPLNKAIQNIFFDAKIKYGNAQCAVFIPKIIGRCCTNC